METKYEIEDLMKYSQEDDFEDGCQMNGHIEYIDHKISRNTIQEAIEAFASFVGVEIKDISKNVCDEAGRIEAQLLENKDGMSLTSGEFERWKDGNTRAWLCDYTGYIKKVERVAVEI